MRNRFVMLKSLAVIIILTVLLSSSQTFAIDRKPAVPDSTVVEQPEELTAFNPYSQISFGISFRVDDTDILDHTPSIQLKIYRQLSGFLSTKFGIGYNSAKFKSKNNFNGVKVRDFMAETGFRWSMNGSQISLYFENGLEYHYYFTPSNVIHEQRIGMNFTLGLQLHIEKNISLDISYGQTINDVNFSASYFRPEESESPNIKDLYPDHLIGLQNNDFYHEIFNPSALKFLIFYKL